MSFLTSNHYIVGCDEVGLGSWAGPILVCALAAPEGWSVKNLRDSKAYASRKARQKVYEALKRDERLVWSVNWCDAREIDELGVARAHKQATRQSLEACIMALNTVFHGAPERVICDGDGEPPILGAECIISADATIPAVMAASVVAKVLHDNYMIEQSRIYKGYGFETNMGYRSEVHEKALITLGVCDLHRKSYAPIRKLLSSQ